MGVTNRSEDTSLQKYILDISINGALTNGETGVMGYIPCPGVIQAGNLACYNTTAGAYLLLSVQRFVVGQGLTTINLGSTFAPPAFGTSGVIPGNGISLPVAGSTLLNVMAHDVIAYQVGGGATVAIYGLAGAIIVKPIQDVVKYLGQSL